MCVPWGLFSNALRMEIKCFKVLLLDIRFKRKVKKKKWRLLLWKIKVNDCHEYQPNPECQGSHPSSFFTLCQRWMTRLWLFLLLPLLLLKCNMQMRNFCLFFAVVHIKDFEDSEWLSPLHGTAAPNPDSVHRQPPPHEENSKYAVCLTALP